jgi:sugar diacid utilization regulator/GAF domain-containing protein
MKEEVRNLFYHKNKLKGCMPEDEKRDKKNAISIEGIIKKYSSLLEVDYVLVFIEGTGDIKLCSYIKYKEKYTRKDADISQYTNLINYYKNVSLEQLAAKLFSFSGISSPSSMLYSPISKENIDIGSVVVGTKMPRIFSNNDKSLIELMGDHLVKSIDLDNYRRKLTKSTKNIALLVEMSELVNCGKNLEEILSRVITKLSEIANAETGGILLYEPQCQQLVLQKPAFGVTNEELIRSYRVPLSTDGNAVKVFTSGKPYISNDAPSDPRLLQKFIKMFNVRNTVSVPLQVEQRTIGVIHLINKRRGFFTQNDVNLLLVLASQIAGLIEKAQMYEEIKRREQETKVLYEIGLDISSKLELDNILQSVVEKSCDLLQCEMAAVTLIDDRAEHGFLRAVHGPMMDTLKNIRLRLDQGIIASVICFKKPVKKVFHFHGSLGEESELELVLKSLGYKSVIAVPLGNIFNTTGVIFCWRKSDLEFSEHEVELLSRLSNQASIAIENARLYEHKEQTVNKLTEFNQIIEHQHGLLKKSLKIHNELTQTVLKNDGLNAIAHTLSKLVNSPVIVLDQFYKRKAYAVDDELKEQILLNDENINKLLKDKEWQQFLSELNKDRKPKIMQAFPKYGFNHSRWIAPIVVGEEIVGYVIILKNSTAEELDIVAIEHATSIFALEMVKKKIAYEVEKKLKVDYLDDLFSGNFDSEKEIIERANYFGYDLSKPNHRVIVVEINDNTKDFKETALNNKIFEIIDDFIKLRSPASITVLKGNTIIIVAELSNVNVEPIGLAKELHNKLKQIFQSCKFNIGIGREVKIIQGFTKSFDEAKQSIKLIEKFTKQGHVVLFEELGIYTLLGQIENEDELKKYATNTLGSLISYDEKKGTEFVHTLLSFLENNCNIQQTAKKTFIHVNTLNYRLSRIQEILASDLRRVDDRLKLHVAFKILELIEH